MKAPLATLGLLAVAGGGCAGAPEIRDDWFARAAERGDALVADFPGAAAVLSGFGEPTGATEFTAGDRALYGLEYRDGDDVQRWTMLLEVVDPAASTDGEKLRYRSRMTLTQTDGRQIVLESNSDVLRLRVTRFDDRSVAGASSEIDVPREFLTYGLARGCAVFESWGAARRDATEEEIRAGARTVGACQALFDVIQQDEVLADVLWKIARTPSVWSVVTNAGVEVSLDLRLNEAVEVSEPAPSFGTTYRLPLVIEANDEPSLLVVADVVEPRSPWNLAAGVVALSAQRPGDDDAYLQVRLLAARRGRD